ncbi:MAG: hypothetical protein ACK5L5_03590 [Bacteroidales bacterium]
MNKLSTFFRTPWGQRLLGCNFAIGFALLTVDPDRSHWAATAFCYAYWCFAMWITNRYGELNNKEQD